MGEATGVSRISAAKGTVLEFTTQMMPSGPLTFPAEFATWWRGELPPGQVGRVMVVVMPAGEDENESAWHHTAGLQLARLSDADLVAQEP